MAATDTFEGSEVYQSLADGKYYMLVENMKDGRYYALWSSSGAGGPWTKVAEKWVWRGNMVYNADKWTTNVSHGELIRAGYNQKLEINDINRVDFLIQGTTSLSGEYQQIIWDLGVIRNYTGSPATPTPTPGPISAFSQIEAESYNTQSGIQTESCTEGGQNIGYIENGDYAVYNNVDFGSGATSFQARVASATSGGNIEIRLDSTSGALVGTCSVAGTGDWQTWTTSTCGVNGVSGTHNLYLRFTGGSGYLFNMNWFEFTSGSTPTLTPVITPTSVVTPTPTPMMTPTPGAGNYIVVYTIQNDWGSGATVDVKVINNTTTAVDGWTLAWTFPGNQTITNAWNSAYTQNGAAVTVKDAGYNANIPANGGSVNFGFNLNYSGANANPPASP